MLNNIKTKKRSSPEPTKDKPKVKKSKTSSKPNMSLARGYRREIEGLPMRGGGIKNKIKNTALSVGGKLLKIGSKTLAKKLKDSDNPVAQVASTVMDTSDKPVIVVNKDVQPVAIQKPAAALPPPPEPNMTKAPEVNPVTAKVKAESAQKTDTIQVQKYMNGPAKRRIKRRRGR